MAVVGLDASNYLEAASDLGFGGDDDDVVMTGWMFDPVGQNGHGFCHLFNTTGASNRNSRSLAAGSTGNPLAWIVPDTGNLIATAAANNPNNAWFGLQSYHGGDTDCEVWLNGGNKGVAAGTLGPFLAPNRFRIGPFKSLTGFNAACGYGEIATWDPDGWSEADRNAFATLVTSGDNPIAIRNQASQPWTGRLVAYYRLEDETDRADLSGNDWPALATIGTISTFGSHPPVDPVPSGASSLLLLSQYYGG